MDIIISRIIKKLNRFYSQRDNNWSLEILMIISWDLEIGFQTMMCRIIWYGKATIVRQKKVK